LTDDGSNFKWHGTDFACNKKSEFQGGADDEKLFKFGYPPATLDGLIEGLDAIDDAIKQQKLEGDAQKATSLRDTAYGLLKGWMSHFRQTAKVVFRQQPEQARKLDF
jgi:hypothetical protein